MERDFGTREERKAPCNCERCQAQGIDLAKEKAEARTVPGADKSQTSNPLAKEISAFEEKNAIEVVRDGKNFEYKMSVNGKDKILTTSDASTKGLEEADKKIAELVAEKEAELTKTFNVAFSKQGDDVALQWVQKADCSWERGPMVKARSANLVELYGIEACLYRCQPSDKTEKGDGVKFHFLQDNYYQKQPVLAYFVASDKDGRPSVYFEPGANKRKPATELDSDRFNKDHLMSVEALTTHELSHNHQAKTGWHNQADKEKFARSIGWMPIVDAKTGATDYLFKGKNGELYRYGKDQCKDSSVWVKCDKNGAPLDEKDRSVGSFKAAKQYKRAEITQLALVKPLTYYFPSPSEMFAEGLMLYRLGGKHQEGLLKDSPMLYKSAKERDQVEIDQRYGTDGAGAPKYIRSIDGLLKSNTEEERKKVEAFEERVRRETDAEIEKAKEKENPKAKEHSLENPKGNGKDNPKSISIQAKTLQRG